MIGSSQPSKPGYAFPQFHRENAFARKGLRMYRVHGQMNAITRSFLRINPNNSMLRSVCVMKLGWFAVLRSNCERGFPSVLYQF